MSSFHKLCNVFKLLLQKQNFKIFTQKNIYLLKIIKTKTNKQTKNNLNLKKTSIKVLRKTKVTLI